MDYRRILSRALRENAIARTSWLALQPATRLMSAVGRPDYPNLIVVGSQKSGTTSFHNYLADHPDIFMSHFKEPALYLDPSRETELDTTPSKLRLGLSDAQLLDVLAIGYRGERWFGESSTYYTMHPYLGSETPELIQTHATAPKVFYVVRDPVERIYSQYLWGERNQFADGDFARVIEKRFDVMASISAYGTQIARYANAIGMENIMVVPFEELTQSPAETMRAAFAFLEVDPDAASDAEYPQFYKSGNRKKFEDDLTIPEHLRGKLSDILQREVDLLSELSGRSFEMWRMEMA